MIWGVTFKTRPVFSVLTCAAVILEPISGSAGVYLPPEGFHIDRIRETFERVLAKQYGW